MHLHDDERPLGQGLLVIELEPVGRRGLGTVITGAGPVLGLAGGAVASSLIVAAAPQMIDLIFVVLLGLLVLQAVGTALSPETVERAPGALASLRPRVSFPPQVRRSAVWVLPATAACWSLGGLIISLGPNLVRSLTGADSVVLTGVVVAALTGTGGIAILFFGSTAPRRVLAVGMSLLLAGMAATIAALVVGSVGLYLAATVLAGILFAWLFERWLGLQENGALLAAQLQALGVGAGRELEVEEHDRRPLVRDATAAYERCHRRLPGSTRTARLRKKREARVLEWWRKRR